MIKNIYSNFCFYSFIVIMCFVSCSKEYESPLKGQQVNNIVLDANQTSQSIILGTKDISKCIATSSETWCTVTITNSSINIKVTPNDTYGERKAMIKIEDPEDATILSFIVIQAQNNAIEIDKQIWVMDPEGGELTININSNVSYKVVMPDQNWLTIKNEKTRNLKVSYLTFVAERNDTRNKRNAEIKLINEETGTTSIFVIEQDIKPYLETDVNEIEVHSSIDDRLAYIIISSNVDYDIIPQEKWMSISESTIQEGLKEDEIKYICFCNIMSYPVTERKGSIIIENSKYNIKKEIVVKQTSLLYVKIEGDITLYEGEEVDLGKLLYNKTGDYVTWWIADENIATINERGVLRAVNEGSTMVFARSTIETHFMHSTYKNVIVRKQEVNPTPPVVGNEVFKIEYVTDGYYSGLPKMGWYIDFNITNISSNKINVTKIVAYSMSGNLLHETNGNHVLDPGTSFKTEIITSEGSIFDNYFWSHNIILYIYYRDLSDNQDHISKYKAGRGGGVLVE